MLGLVRHQILIQNKLLINNKIVDVNSAVEYIGESSFKWDQTDQTFSKISGLSPCYLVYNERGVIKKYLPYHQKFVESIQKVDNHFVLPDHDPKTEYLDVWKCISDGTTICNHNSYIYKEIERTGNEKNYSGKKEEKGYFKQIWLSLSKGFCFGFYVKIAEDVDFKNNEVIFGKENSPFIMEVSENQAIEEKVC
ncbi:MAG: hypothetical protein IPJ54_00165 [Saprospiraceae bacterium]|nr:hypothetical protein [Saprospiraceae bacterium]